MKWKLDSSLVHSEAVGKAEAGCLQETLKQISNNSI